MFATLFQIYKREGVFIMSLLWMDYEEEFQNLVDVAYQCESNERKEVLSALDQSIQKLVYRDTRYNIDFLYTAYILKDEEIMRKYAIWLNELMTAVLKKQTRQETLDYVLLHLDFIIQAVKQTIKTDK